MSNLRGRKMNPVGRSERKRERQRVDGARRVRRHALCRNPLVVGAKSLIETEADFSFRLCLQQPLAAGLQIVAPGGHPRGWAPRQVMQEQWFAARDDSEIFRAVGVREPRSLKSGVGTEIQS